MKKLKVKLPHDSQLRDAELVEYDKEFKECIVDIYGAWKSKTRIAVTLDEIYIGESNVC